MAELPGHGIRDAHHRRGMEARADREAAGQVLARAVKWPREPRGLLNGHKTGVFR